MTEDLKRKILIFIVLAAILLIVLAGALPRLQLQPGIPLPGRDVTPQAGISEVVPPVSISISTFFKAVVGVILVLALALGIYQVLRGTPWKDLLVTFISIVVGTVVFLGILALLVNVHITANPVLPEILPTAIPIPHGPEGPMPFDFIWLAGIVLALGVIGLGAWLAFRRKEAPAAAMLALQLEAEQALQDILSGLDLRGVIIQCYRQMSKALQKEGSIELEDTMTAREFEGLLNRRGFPPEPVRMLTLLFEYARYSSHPLVAADEKSALESLEEIVAFCRLATKPGLK